MKILFASLLLLLFTIAHPASYKDNQTDIYVKDYSGAIIKNGDISYQASRIIIGVKENVTKEDVEEIAKSVGGKVSGWVIFTNSSDEDNYIIDISAEKLDQTLLALRNTPELLYAIKNQVYEKIHFTEDELNETLFDKKYAGEIVKDKRGVYFQANTILLGVKKNVSQSNVEDLIKQFGGQIYGWSKTPYAEGDSYDILVPADQRELAIAKLELNPQVRYASRNSYEFADASETSDSVIKQLISIFLIALIIFIAGFFIFKKLKGNIK